MSLQLLVVECIYLSVHHIEGVSTHLGPVAGLEAAVGVHPQAVRVARQNAGVYEGLDLGAQRIHGRHGRAAGSRKHCVSCPLLIVLRMIVCAMLYRDMLRRHSTNECREEQQSSR